MILREDRGRALAVAVSERVTAEYPSTSAEIRDGGGIHGTIATFTPRNSDGVPLSLIAVDDWSFHLHAGRFILVDDEPMRGSEDEHVDLIVTAILRIARDGLSRGFLDRLFSFGRDQVAPWEK